MYDVIEYLDDRLAARSVIGAVMGNSDDHQESRLLVPKTEGNPDGKGSLGFLDDWRITEPRGVVAKPQRQVLAELFTSMLPLPEKQFLTAIFGCRFSTSLPNDRRARLCSVQ